MKRGVNSELSLRGEIEHVLQYGRPKHGRWTVGQLVTETDADPLEVKAALDDLQDEGMIALSNRGREAGWRWDQVVVQWN